MAFFWYVVSFWCLFNIISDYYKSISFGLEEIVCSFFLWKNVFKGQALAGFCFWPLDWIAHQAKSELLIKMNFCENSCLRLDLYWFNTFFMIRPSPSVLFLQQRDPFNEFYFVTNWISMYVLYWLVCFVIVRRFLLCLATLKSIYLSELKIKHPVSN